MKGKKDGEKRREGKRSEEGVKVLTLTQDDGSLSRDRGAKHFWHGDINFQDDLTLRASCGEKGEISKPLIYPR